MKDNPLLELKYQVINIMVVEEGQEKRILSVKKKANIKFLLMRIRGKIIRKMRKSQSINEIEESKGLFSFINNLYLILINNFFL